MPNEEDKGGKNRILALLKEWQLCQDDANAYNHWAWQIGAILIALSLAAMWIQFQIEKSNRFAYSVPLGIFSIVSILIWDFWIVVRARFFINLAYRRARDLEHEIGLLCYGNARVEFHHPHPWRRDEGPTHILHTFIDEEDNRPHGWRKYLRSIYGVILFNAMIIVVWALIIYFNWSLTLDP